MRLPLIWFARIAQHSPLRLLARITPWALPLLLLTASALLGYQNGLGRGDLLLQDWASRQQNRPADPEIALIVIDDTSIAALGRWPWPRELHAQLLDRLQQLPAKAIGYDVIFSEAAEPSSDAQLAKALRANGNVVLPVFDAWQNSPAGVTTQTVLPLPTLAAAAAGLGHIHPTLDADGVVRQVPLARAPGWPHLSAALLALDSQAVPADFSPRRIAFSGPAGQYPQYSFAEVWAGKVDPALLRGKYLLVGAAATGLGDAYATPSTHAEQRMTGVEILAHTLAMLKQGLHWRSATGLENALFTALWTALAWLAIRYTRPQWALLALLISLPAIVLCTSWLLASTQVLVAPLAALCSVVLLYPIWSWLRLELAVRFFARELARIRAEDPVLASLPQSGAGADVLGRKMATLGHAVGQLAGLRRLVHESLAQLADGVLICDADGAVVLSNPAAQRLLPKLESESRPQVLALLAAQGAQLEAAALFAPTGYTQNLQLADGAAVLLSCRPRLDRQQQLLGWVMSLTDLSVVQAAQAARDEALDFLSHDMRSPQSAILALLELHAGHASAGPDLLARIRQHAERSLALAEDFIQLARARHQQYHFAPTDLLDLCYEISDSCWEKAQLHAVRINVRCESTTNRWAAYPADRSLLGRAIGNLIENALKYAASGGQIDCLIRDGHAGGVILAVRDYGPGLSAAQLMQLGQKFKQLASGASGAGLGLSLVQTVVARHGGELEINNAAGGGLCFQMILPMADNC
ncbi:CHASE2 domain-containing protein [Chitinibacter tainanensis]|uniref:CHASE2 domain-containing protein n=1 Tax=Chitinibacter tainanensis TaxID=230667 RepID=UPI002356B9FD|nr:CHASE2 domain-containing protein [Chitinibacter tainanensis]